MERQGGRLADCLNKLVSAHGKFTKLATKMSKSKGVHEEVFDSLKGMMDTAASGVIPKISDKIAHHAIAELSTTLAVVEKRTKELSALSESQANLKKEKSRLLRELDRELQACRRQLVSQGGQVSAQTQSAQEQNSSRSSAERSGPNERVKELLMQLWQAFRSSPPPGVSLAYVDGFMQRNFTALARILESKGLV